MVVNPITSGGGSEQISFGTFNLSTGSALWPVYTQSFPDRYTLNFVIGMTWAEYIQQINAGSLFSNDGSNVGCYIEGEPSYLYLADVRPTDEIINEHTYTIMSY